MIEYQASSNQAEVPFVVVHMLLSSWLSPILGNAVDSVGPDRVVLIGDFSNDVFDRRIRHRRMDRLWGSDGDALLKTYTHLSTQPREGEMLCCLRWFAIRGFMRREGIQRCVAMDSDTLLLADIADELRTEDVGKLVFPYQPHMPEGKQWVAPQVCWIGSLDAIESLCEFISNSYTEPERKESLETYWDWVQATGEPGGVSDMVHIWRWSKANPDRIRFTDPPSEAVTRYYDNAVWHDEGQFEIKDGIKDLSFDAQRVPTLAHKSGVTVSVPALHFQGHSKASIRRFAGDYTDCVSKPKVFARRVERKLKVALHRPVSLIPPAE